jgi:hypothetical protein
LIPILSKSIFYLTWTLQSYEIYKYKNLFVTYKGGNNHKHDRFYADRHVNKPAVHHNAPAAHHRSAMPLGSSKNAPVAHRNAPAPAPHNGKPAAAHNDRKGADRHMAMNTNRGNGGHFGRR